MFYYKSLLEEGKLNLRTGDIIGANLGEYDTSIWDIRGVRPVMVVGVYRGLKVGARVKVIPLTKNADRNKMGGRDTFYTVPLEHYRDRGTFGVAVVDNETEIKTAQIFKLSWDGVRSFDDSTLNEILTVRSVYIGVLDRATGARIVEGIRKARILEKGLEDLLKRVAK